MFIEYNLIITVAMFVGVLSILGASALFLYSILKKESDFQEHEKETFTNYKRVIKNAHKHARSLLYQASRTAETIINSSHGTNADLEADIDKILQAIAQKHITSINNLSNNYEKEYQQKLTQIEEQLAQNSTSSIQEAQTISKKILEEYATGLLKQSAESEEIVHAKTQEFLAQAEREIQEYKKSKIEEVNTKADKVIQKVYRDVLHASFSPEFQSELIIKSLEKAKREGMFDL